MKYIAFNLYRKNDKGGHSEALELKNQPHGVQVMLVADVEALLWNIESADDPAAVAGTALKDLMGS